MAHELVVDAHWDPETRVWLATSNDVAGVAVEADSTAEIMDILTEVLPHLLKANGAGHPASSEANASEWMISVRFAQREEALVLEAA